MDWTTPGPEEVALGVHRIPLPLPSDGLHAVNVYAITDGERTTLIDGGWKIDPAREALHSALAVVGVKLQDVDRCLVTHHHRDHYTLAVELRRRSGLILALGKGERANIEAARKPRRSFSAQRDLLQTAGAFSVLAAIDAMDAEAIDPEDYELPDIWLDDGEQVNLGERTLLVRATPGHTAGHVVFVDESASLLFAGDHILPHITPSIGFQAAGAETPLADYLSSLAVILAEPDRLLLPAHGPAGGSAHRRVEELLQHHELRLERTASAVRAGSGTGYRTASALRWTRRERHFDELDPFNQMLAVTETVAHLDVLVAQGRVTAGKDDGVRTYTFAG